MLKITLATLALVAATAGTAAAQYAPRPYTPPAEEHNGFFARGYLGPAWISSTFEDDVLEVTGAGAVLGLAAGAAVTPNIVIYGEVFADVALGPDFRMGGVTVETDDRVSFGVAGLGAGLAYYTPSNFFVSGTLSFSQLSLDDDTEDDEEPATSDFGPGVSLLGGKEWWVARNTAIGAAAQLFFGSQPREGGDGTWRTTAFGLAITASYN